MRRLIVCLPLLAGCTADKGAHFLLTGDARKDWKKAAAQVLKDGYCGVKNPTPEQIESTALKLREINERHLREDLSGFQFFDLNIPAGVDHRYPRRIPRTDTLIFVSREICPKEQMPDAGASDAAGIKAGAKVIDLDDGQMDAGAKETRPKPTVRPVPSPGPVSKPPVQPTATSTPYVPGL